MMGDVFGSTYAAAYDSFYGEKDYVGECDALEALFNHDAAAPVTSILDLGCGTGSHAVSLALRGYDVTGVDRSADMLRRAADKAKAAGVSPTFECADLRTYRDSREYDAVVMMFAVLGYQQSNHEVMDALHAVRRHLRLGGVFVADFWYGPAVLSQRPSSRAAFREKGPHDMVVRVAEPTLDVLRHVCHVDYRIMVVENGQLTSQAAERHTMRFFFSKELEVCCEFAQLKLRRLLAFPACEREPSVDDWNALLVAEAI
jgi:SAM-dependent methyltransferase